MEKPIEIETDSGKFIIRRFRKDDEKKVLKLWELVFHQKMDPALWRWKYFDHPYSQALLLCESDKKEVLALYGGIPFKAYREGQSVVIVQLMDIMSHPNFRGKGLFARTGQAFFEIFCNKKTAEILYGFPGKFHFDLGKRILGYAPLQSRVAYLRGITDVLASRNRGSLLKIRRIEEPGEEFDRLWKKCSNYYPYAVVRQSEFLQWRFCRHPERRYEIFCLKGFFSNEIKGYGVFYFKEGAAILVDMLFPKSEKILGVFFSKIGQMLKLRNVSQVQTWLPGSHFLKKAAITAGFEEHNEPLGIISTIKSFDHSPDTEWIDKNFYYTMADADLY
jgi:hypothetical protein